MSALVPMSPAADEVMDWTDGESELDHGIVDGLGSDTSGSEDEYEAECSEESNSFSLSSAACTLLLNSGSSTIACWILARQ